MIPVLYKATETVFSSNGLGALADVISCVVTEERNGEYELVMEYPITGLHADEVEDRAIITAIPSPYRTAQPFRIYSIETPMNGIMTIHARHISYDLSGIPVEPFSAGTCATALDGLVSHSVVTCPFTVSTDKLVTGTFQVTTPKSFRSCLGGSEGSILDIYGTGEYTFDKFSVTLNLHRGSDTGVRIAYGKNLTDFNMERNLDTIVTGVYPYWAKMDEDGSSLVELDQKIIVIYDPFNPAYIKASGGEFLRDDNGDYLVLKNPFPFNNVETLDLSASFESEPTQEQLLEAAEKYINDHNLGVPQISIKASFVDLGTTDEYSDLAVLEQCDLCDTVTVEFPVYGISVKSKIVRIETDVLLERYNSIDIGSSRVTLADTISDLTMTSVTKAELKTGSAQAADVINNTHGTFEWIDEDGDGRNEGFTIYESDGVAFLRCTAGGIGLSQDGGLTYTNAITKTGVTASRLYVRDGNQRLMQTSYSHTTSGEWEYRNTYLYVFDPVYNTSSLIIRGYNQDGPYTIGSSQLIMYDASNGNIGMQISVGYNTNSLVGGQNSLALYDTETSDTRQVINLAITHVSGNRNAMLHFYDDTDPLITDLLAIGLDGSNSPVIKVNVSGTIYTMTPQLLSIGGVNYYVFAANQ